MKLSKRQAQIAGMIADGKSVGQVALELRIGEGSVRTQIARSLKKKGLATTRQLIFYVLRKREKRSKQILYIKDTQAAT